MTDDYLLQCISELYEKYRNTAQTYTLRNFYSNKVDPIKFTFDMAFYGQTEEEKIMDEILRQVDKTIYNALGDFHQKLFGGIDGFEAPPAAGYDVRKLDNTIFAEVKNKHNTMNSGGKEAVFQKLQRLAEENAGATCYLVEIIAERSQDIRWEATLNGTFYSHPRVRRISADKFYALVTGRENAFYELCTALPQAIQDFMSGRRTVTQQNGNNRVYIDLERLADDNGISVITLMMRETFSEYNGSNE